MDNTEIVLIVDNPTQRLDKFVLANLDGMSRTQVQTLIREGLVTVDGKVEKTGFKFKGGETVRVILPVEEETELGHVGWDSSTLTYIWPWNGVDVMLAFSVAFHRKRGEAAFHLLGRLHRTIRHPSPHHQCPGNFQPLKCYIL